MKKSLFIYKIYTDRIIVRMNKSCLIYNNNHRKKLVLQYDSHNFQLAQEMEGSDNVVFRKRSKVAKLSALRDNSKSSKVWFSIFSMCLHKRCSILFDIEVVYYFEKSFDLLLYNIHAFSYQRNRDSSNYFSHKNSFCQNISVIEMHLMILDGKMLNLRLIKPIYLFNFPK